MARELYSKLVALDTGGSASIPSSQIVSATRFNETMVEVLFVDDTTVELPWEEAPDGETFYGEAAWDGSVWEEFDAQQAAQGTDVLSGQTAAGVDSDE